MSMVTEPDMSRSRFAQRTPLPGLHREPKHLVSMPLPEDLLRALAILVADFSSTSFLRMQTIYCSALRLCQGSQRFELAQATVDRYLELTVVSYRRYSQLVEDFTPSLCSYWQRGPSKSALVINMAICGAAHFVKLLQDCLQRREEAEYALRAALKAGRPLYIKWLCTVAYDFPDLPQIVVDVVWSVRHDHLHALLRHCACCTCLATELTKRYLTKTLNETSSWMEPDPDYDMGPLATWMVWHFMRFHHMDIRLGLTQRQKELLPDFANFCIHQRGSVVPISMAVIEGDWPLVLSILRRSPEELQCSSFPLTDFLLFMRKKAPLDTMVKSVISAIDRSAISTLRFDSWILDTQYLIAMSNHCLASGCPKWAIFFLLHTNNWDRVLARMESHNDIDTADMVILHASRYNNWDVVSALLPFSSRDNKFLSYVFQRAAKECKVDVVERLLPHVDLALLPFVQGDDEGPLAIFNTMLDFAPQTSIISKVRIVLLLVRQGLASHIRIGESTVEDAIEQRMPTIARLLLDVGMVNKYQLRKTLQSARTRHNIRSHPHLRQAVDRIVHDINLDHPRTLQDSCRLMVSHRIGFGRVRKKRIEQLPLPRKLKDLVALSDLCEPVEANIEKGLGATNFF